MNLECLNQMKSIADRLTTATDEKFAVVKEWYQRFQDKQKLIENITKEFVKQECVLKKEYEQLQLDISNMTIKRELKLQEVNRVTNKTQVSQKELDVMISKLEHIHKKVELIREGLEPTTTDKKMYNKAKQKLQIYRDITNIKWDYTVPLNVAAKGYVRNKEAGFCHPFKFKNEGVSHEELVEKVWSEVALSAQDDWTQQNAQDTDRPEIAAETTEFVPEKI